MIYYNGITKKYFLLIKLLLVILFFSTPAFSFETFPEIRADFNRIKKEIIRVIPDNERKIVNNIILTIPNSLSFTHTKAFKNEYGEDIVSINIGTYTRLSALSQAILYKNVGYNDLEFINGYIRYLAYAETMGKHLLSPQEFAAKYSISFKPYLGLSEEIFNRLSGQLYADMFSFVIAHEMAHHVLGHTKQKPSSLAESRKMEKEADAWAAFLLIKLNHSNIPAVYSMLLFNELDEKTIQNEGTSRHPSALKRALPLTKVSIIGLKKSHQGQHLKDAIKSVKEIQSRLEKQLAFQEKADLDPKLWIKKAKQGDRYAQLKVGRWYSTGEQGYRYDLDKMLYWYTEAADNTVKFDYFDAADAEYRIGYSYAYRNGVKHNYKLAKKYLTRSAKKDYYPGIHALRNL